MEQITAPSKEAVMAVTTAFFTFLALALFVRSVLRGTAKPYVWAWVIRVAICAVAFWSQLLEGATYSLALAVSQIVCGFCILALIWYKRPARGRLDTTDWLTLGLALAGVGVWVASGDSLFGLLGVIAADMCATAMGIRASLRSGMRESIAFWFCALCAASAAMAAAQGNGWIIVLAPLFSCVNALVNIFAVLLLRSRQPVMLVEEAKD